MPVIWSIADLHLSFGVPNKEMDIFGKHWERHPQKIEEGWRSCVSENDLVLIPGDISWGMRREEAKIDLDWIDKLPGTKLLLKGNHDYWWESSSKVKAIMPPSCHFIQNDSYTWNNVAIAGSRLWDTSEFSFEALFEGTGKRATEKDDSADKDRIFKRELGRLEMSLKVMNPHASTRIAMTHYPPIGLDLKDSEVSKMLEKYKVNICVFGHLHNVKPGLELFGEHHGIQYYLTACDYLDFKPQEILTFN